MPDIELIQNLHWKFPNTKSFIRLEKLKDHELENIRTVVRRNKHTTKVWFAISSEQWFNDITLLLKHRKKDKELTLQNILPISK